MSEHVVHGQTLKVSVQLSNLPKGSEELPERPKNVIFTWKCFGRSFLILGNFLPLLLLYYN